jgi:hypothetical protein
MAEVVFIRNRVVAARPPRVTSADAFERKPAARDQAVAPKSLNSVVGTTGSKTAGTARSEQEHLHGGNQYLVRANHADNCVLGKGHFRVPYFNKPAFRRVVKKSLSTAA